jgi:hypothetical protein
VTTLNLVLRFALEVSGVVAVAYVAYQAGDGPMRWALAIGAPAVIIGLWAFVIAPGASNPIPAGTRVVLGSVVLLMAAGALYLAGLQLPAAVFAGLIAINTLLLFLLPE